MKTQMKTKTENLLSQNGVRIYKNDGKVYADVVGYMFTPTDAKRWFAEAKNNNSDFSFLREVKFLYLTQFSDLINGKICGQKTAEYRVSRSGWAQI